MRSRFVVALAPSLLVGVVPAVGGQTFEGPGSRAQGMAAFVAVADDASAVYWNPAGLASGAYFSLLLDRTEGESRPDTGERGGKRSSWLLALGAPALGLSYYRLQSSSFAPADAAGQSRVEALVTHHAGATLVQTVFEGLAVGATLKLVRGTASAGTTRADPRSILDDVDFGLSTNRFDMDVGVMATGRFARAGLTVRNVVEPEFETADGGALVLDRQARAGVALLLTPQWTAAADLDLTRHRGPFGEVRMLAVGTEARPIPRAQARAGVQVNVAGGDRMPVGTFGGSYAVMGSLLVDAHFSKGAEGRFTGWGVAGRVVF